MGQMVDGVWESQERLRHENGNFIRPSSSFRNRIEPGGRFAPEPGRYRLYVSLACPWAHRTLIFRALKGLQDMIPVYVTHWLMADQGWTFAPDEGVVPDPEGAAAMHEIYRRADPKYTGRVTVPVLWDTREGTIVNNESAEIIRMLNSAFDGVGAKPGDYYPPALRAEIDALDERIYTTVNNGVYRAGFARTQDAYDSAVTALFETLDWLEERLRQRPFLCGDRVTEADWRLFTTLIRFDPVYQFHFKCNIRSILSYPALWDYTRSLRQIPGVAETIDLRHIKLHYFRSHTWLNPTGIVPKGPKLDFSQPGTRIPKS